jgi:hypothetical protein
MVNMPYHRPTEKNYYLPILNTLRSYEGRASLEEIRISVRKFLRADDFHLDARAGNKTKETSFGKNLNFAGKRLSDAGLVRKLKTHWELTDEGLHNHFTIKTLTLLCRLAKKNASKGRSKN